MSRHALVTGASRGIGAAIAEALLAQGCRVTALARDGARLQTRWAGRENVQTEVCDVTDAAAVEALDLGPIDILINNAGAAESAPFARTDDALLQRMLDLNLTSAARLARLVLPGMRERGWGRIVNVASTAGLKGYPYVTAYCAAKHGLVGLTRALGVELAKTGVTANAVCPGFTDTDLVARSLDLIESKTGKGRDEALSDLTRANPQGRLITPEEVAASVVWLCSDAAASVTGQTIAIDGGETA
ncbi:MAG: SDR family NAD(P)-dependent oxidoreductase [Caulobacteraceae bacterium]